MSLGALPAAEGEEGIAFAVAAFVLGSVNKIDQQQIHYTTYTIYTFWYRRAGICQTVGGSGVSLTSNGRG